MGADYVVGLTCAPKLEFGRGGASVGTAAMVDLLKSASRAAAVREIATRKGEDPNTIKIAMRRHNPDGSTAERGVTLTELESEARGLDGLAHYCDDCPANVLRQPFGCAGALRYPISEAAEMWVMNFVQPQQSLGGHLLTSAVRDFGLTGQSSAGARQTGMFQRRSPVKITVSKKLFRKTEFTSDQLFDALLFMGALNPSHCLGILLWLGAVRFDNRPLLSLDETPRLSIMTSIPVSERFSRTKLAIPDVQAASPLGEMRTVLEALLTAWRNDVPLLMDS